MTDKPELRLGKKLPAAYGSRYKGKVIIGESTIGVTYREPPHPDKADTVYEFLNGLMAGKGTMRMPALQAVLKGHKTVTLDYHNRGIRGALNANAKDAAAVIDSLDPGLKKRMVGLSEGGRVATRALTMVESPVEAATFVAPAGFILNNHLSWGQGIRRLGAAGPEMVGMGVKHPIDSAHLIASCVSNCVQRPFGVLGEMHELRSGSEHDTFSVIKARSEAPYLRFAYGVGDSLLQAERQIAGIAGLAFDDVLPYDGRHCDITNNPELSVEIYRRDAQIADLRPARVINIGLAA